MKYERSGITGKIVERELFGRSRYLESRENPPESRYVSYLESVSLLKKLQPFDPTDPEPDFANSVHYYVFERLGLDAQQLHFYTAVESPSDWFHGIDGWFEISTALGQLQVTVDLTTNPNKDRHKADVIFLVPGDGLDRKVDKEQFLKYTDDLASRVVELFRELQGLRGPERRIP